MKPEFKHLRVFGCLCYVTNNTPQKGKFDPRADPCVFIGYPFSQKGYKVFNLKTHSAQVSRDVIFHEDIFPYKDHVAPAGFDMPIASPPVEIYDASDHDYTIKEKVDTNQNSDSLDPISGSTDLSSDTDVSDETIQEVSKRKLGRIRYLPNKLKDYVCDIPSSSQTRYPLSAYVNYTGCTPMFQRYALTLLLDTEPQSFMQASQDPA